MQISLPYPTWSARIHQPLRDKRITQVRSPVRLLVGNCGSKSIHGTKTAMKKPVSPAATKSCSRPTQLCACGRYWWGFGGPVSWEWATFRLTSDQHG